MEMFEAAAEEAFVLRVMAHLRREHSDVVGRLSENVLKKMVQNGLIRARAYGFEWESNLTAFVALMFHVAPNFDEQSRIQAVLHSKDILVEERMDVLFQRTVDQDWVEAKRSYDAEAWFPWPNQPDLSHE